MLYGTLLWLLLRDQTSSHAWFWLVIQDIMESGCGSRRLESVVVIWRIVLSSCQPVGLSQRPCRSQILSIKLLVDKNGGGKKGMSILTYSHNRLKGFGLFCDKTHPKLFVQIIMLILNRNIRLP